MSISSLNIEAPGGVLLLGTPTTSTGELLAYAAIRRGLEVRRVTGPQDLIRLAGRPAYWYGGPHAAGRVVGRLGIGLLEPEDAWLPGLDPRYSGRRIEAATLAEAWALTKPAFIKPPRDKSFPARVYRDGLELRWHSGSLPQDTPALISDVIDFAVEYRLFLLDGDVAAASRYAVHGRLEAAPLEGDAHEREVRAFAAELTASAGASAGAIGMRGSLPSAVVVDVGLGRDSDTGRERWVVVESNMAWFAHSYAADPDGVLEVVLRSAGPLGDVRETDLAYLRAA